MTLPRLLAALTAAALAAAPLTAQNQPGHVVGHTYITQDQGGFAGPLASHANLGAALCVVGDVDGDGVDDLAVGAPGTSVGAASAGAVWILFMTAEGTVDHAAVINAQVGSLPFTLEQGDRFGAAVAPAGDLDGDGVPDLWVGAPGDDDDQPVNAAAGPGCLYSVRLTFTGKVRSAHKLSASSTGMTLDPVGAFGSAVAPLGDLDGDGVIDLLVGAPLDSTGGPARGAVWTLVMKPTGFVEVAKKLAGGGALTGVSGSARFGSAVTGLGDLDGNGSLDFAVGAPFDSVLNTWDGSVWLCLTALDGSLAQTRRLAADLPAFGAQAPGFDDRFGSALARLGDLDGDGDEDLVVGVPRGGNGSRGALWFVRTGGADGLDVEGLTLVDDDDGFLPRSVNSFDYMGAGAAAAGDWDHDGVPDLFVGVPGANHGGTDSGALALLRLRGPTFRDLGHARWGELAPVLTGAGSLVAGESFKLYLTGAQPSGEAHLVVGLTALGLPFQGGVMVPNPDLLLLELPVQPDGGLTLESLWPADIPVGLEVFAQSWMKDGGTPTNWGASNGLLLVAGA